MVTPFNFPLVIPSWKIAPALVHGNTVVWKASELAPAVAFELVRVFHDAGLPPGVLNLLVGPGETGSAVANHELLDALTFTGSVPVGRQLARQAAERNVRLQLELGGHNVAVVFPDADLDLAAREAAAGAMLGAGQKCTSTRRIVVHREVHDALVERLAEVVTRYKVGDGREPNVDIGPVISHQARGRIEKEIESACASGARVAAQAVVPSPNRGYFVAPTVLVDAEPHMRFVRQEVFGPVTAVLAANDESHAIELANDTSFGLSASVFTESMRRVRRCAEEIDVGVLHVNSQTTGAEPHVPFGARRDSSSAQSPSEQGHSAREFFTWRKTVYEVAT